LLLISVAAAYRSPSAPAHTETSGTLLFPELRNQIASVTQISLQRQEKQILIQKNERGNWVLPFAANYPVDIAKIRMMLAGLSEIATVEPKTSDPNRYATLGVQDLETKGSTSLRLTVLGAKDTPPLVDLIVGSLQRVGGTASSEGFYARKSEELQSWLVKGKLDFEFKVGEFLKPHENAIAPDTIRSIQYSVDGKKKDFTIQRQKAEFPFHLTKPKDVFLGPDADIAALLKTFEALGTQNVRSSAGFKFLPKETTVINLRSFNGLAWEIKTTKIDGSYWFSVSASADEPSQKKLAASIRAEFSPWVYQADDAFAKTLRLSLGELTKVE